MRLRLLVLLLCVSSACLGRERYRFSNLSLEDGLSQITVICIHQDSNGFMWFGTRNGLNCYDGYGFDVYFSDSDDYTSISDNHILSIAEDNKGNLWVGTNNGLNKMALSANTFERYFSDPDDDKSLSHNIIQSLYYDKEDNLWIGTYDGLCLLDPETGTFRRIFMDDVLHDNPIYTIVRKGEKLYLGTYAGGLVIYDLSTGDHSVYSHDPRNAASVPHNFIRAVHIDRQDNLWVGTHHSGVWISNPTTGDIRIIDSGSGLSNNHVRCIYPSPGGDILVGTFDGLNIIDPNTLEVERYDTYGNDNGDLSHYSIYSIYFDRSDALWVGTYAGGVNYYNPYGQKFRFNGLAQGTNELLGIIGAMYEGEDHIYLCSEGSGLIEMDKSGRRFNNYMIFDGQQRVYAMNIAKSLYHDGNKLLYGTNTGAVYAFDYKTHRFNLLFDTGFDNPVYYIGRNSKGEYMVGGVSEPAGLVFFGPGGTAVRSFPVKGRADQSFANVRVVMEIEEERYLIGTRNDGLYDYNASEQRLIRYKKAYYTHGEFDIPDNYVSSIIKDSGGTYWVGTFGGGFSRFDPVGGTFQTFNTKNGLLNNNVCSIVEDRRGHLWISSIDGISDFDPATGQFVNYTHTDGVQISEFTPHSGIMLSNRHIMFGGDNGVISFNPEFMQSNPYVPPVVLRNLYVNNNRVVPGDGSSVLTQSLHAQPSITLRYDQSNFNIEYSALNYVFPERNQYVYRLEGFDHDWIDVGTRHIAYYTNIPAGKYRFVVKGSNNDGIWNDNLAVLMITVLPPFWKTWWAYTIYWLVGAGVAFMILRYFGERRRHENERKLSQAEARAKEEFHSARNKLFTNFSHELRTPLTLIISPLDNLVEKQTDLPGNVRQKLLLIQNNSLRLLRLVNNLMDFQKKESGTLQLKKTEGEFASFAREMTDVFLEMARARDITLETDTPPGSIPYMFDSSLMEKVFFNYLSNAFKNVPNGGTIRLTVRLTDLQTIRKDFKERAKPFTRGDIKYIFMEISDSGAGIPEEELENIFTPFYQVAQNEHSASGTGLGLSLSKAIIEMHHGIIWAESPEGSGASFRTILPVLDEIQSPAEEGEAAVVQPRTKTSIPVEKHIERTENDTPSAKKKYTLLIVEDNTDVRKYIVDSLADKYNIMESANGKEGFDKAVYHLPDLIISDIMMPKMDGIEMVEKLKADLNTSHIPVIVITAKAMVTDIMAGYKVGVDDYVVKPFNSSLLVSRVENLIRTREKLKAVYGKRFSLESLGVEAVSVDELFMTKLYNILEKNLSNPKFNLDAFCKDIGMSHANLYRKVKAVTNLSPNEFIRNFRLEMGAKILREAKMSVSDVYVAVGFNSLAYFSNCFKALYGITPSEYASGAHKNKP